MFTTVLVLQKIEGLSGDDQDLAPGSVTGVADLTQGREGTASVTCHSLNINLPVKI